MVLLVVAVLVLAISHGSSATWCTCKEGLSEAVLQKTLDYACGAGADCNPIKQNGVCFQPNTVRAHCSYAVNSYYQKKGQAAGSCDFAGTAAFSAYDLSISTFLLLLSVLQSRKNRAQDFEFFLLSTDLSVRVRSEPDTISAYFFPNGIKYLQIAINKSNSAPTPTPRALHELPYYCIKD
ncbi:hypothetical protein SAY87_003932 [Trapa incisa]|uniref:X8 domain-containing protein n=1 Tax=Trapa incisa TaxID=236973 RepID=A0AAN7JN59_9MYRT|nr:hypothetical protein SAY87_003932 [Trapa incisa]